MSQIIISGLWLKQPVMQYLFTIMKVNLKYANPAFYSMIGLNPCLYYKSNPADLLHPDDREFDDQRTEALEKNGFFDT